MAASLSCDSRTTNSLRCAINGLSYPYNSINYGDVAWYKGTSVSGTPVAQNQSLTYTYTGYSAGTNYDVCAKIWWKDPNNGGAGAGWIQIGGTYYTFQTQCATPSFSSYSNVTSSSITVTFNSVTGASQYEIVCSNGSSSIGSRTATFNNLSANTQYGFKCRALASSGSPADSAFSSYSYVTTAAGVPPVPSADVYINSRIEGGFNLAWGSSSGATSYDLAYKYTYDSSFTVVNVSGMTYQLTGRNCGVQHTFKVRAKNAAGSSGYTGETLGTTLPRSPTIALSAKTTDTIDLSIGNMDGNFDYVKVWKDSNASDYKNLTKAQWDSGQRVVTFTGLNQGQTYNFKAQSYFFWNSADLWSYYTREVNVTTNSRPGNFAWDTAKTSGGTFNLTAAEWNRLTAKINEFRSYKGLSIYSFTSASVGASFTATMFNQARSAISSMNSDVPSSKNSGGIVYANDLNWLRDALNAVT